MITAAASSSVERYVKTLPKYDRLTSEQELALADRIRNNPAGSVEWTRARNQLVTANLRFALHQAHQAQSRSSAGLDELVAEANIGLIRAAELFDPRKNPVRFTTYALWWVQSKLRIFIARDLQIVKFGTTNDEREWINKVRSRYNQLRADHRDATELEIFELMAIGSKLTAERLQEIYQRVTVSSISLDVPMQGSDHKSKAQSYKDVLVDHSPLPDELLEREQTAAHVRSIAAYQAKNPREAYLLKYRLLSSRPKTLDEIGKKFGVTRERVRQIQEKLLERLRESL